MSRNALLAVLAVCCTVLCLLLAQMGLENRRLTLKYDEYRLSNTYQNTLSVVPADGNPVSTLPCGRSFLYVTEFTTRTTHVTFGRGPVRTVKTDDCQEWP